MKKIFTLIVPCILFFQGNIFSQKVGIGTTSPAFKLDVKGGSINTDSVYRIGGSPVLSAKGNGNSFVGINSGFLNSTGHYNTANGHSTLYNNSTGSYNTASGSYSLYFNSSGNFNTTNGYSTLYNNSTGSSNTANGYAALYSNSTGNYNTANGENALYTNSSGLFNTAIGKDALFANSTGYGNTATGKGALFANSTGQLNTASGVEALLSNSTGNHNTAFGVSALSKNTTGFGNTAVGSDALNMNITGGKNTALGGSAFFYLSNLTNTTCIGYASGGMGNANNRIEIGNSSVDFIGGQVGFSSYSDGRIKTQVQENVPGLKFISLLRPVTYHFDIHKQNEMSFRGGKNETDWEGKYDIEQKQMTGFIAQEVEQAAQAIGYKFSGVDKPKNPNDIYGLRYSEFVVPLVKAMQEQQVMIEQQQLQIDELKKIIKELRKK